MAVLVNIDHETTHTIVDASNYDSAQEDSGDLTIADGGLAGTGHALSVLINEENAKYGQKNLAKQTTLRTRFYIDPNSISMADSEVFIPFLINNNLGGNIGVLYLYYYTTTGLQLVFNAVNDAGGAGLDSSFNITDAPHYVEFLITKAATNISSDGTAEWWVDGVSKGSAANIDNFNRMDDDDFRVRIGYISIGAAPTTTGTLLLDELVVNNDGSEIGAVGGGATETDMTLTGGITPSGTLSNSKGSQGAGAITPSGTLSAAVGGHITALAVAASADDADEAANGTVSITANPLANVDRANVWNGFIFRGITIPSNATITSAKLTVRFTSASLDEPDVTFYGLDTAAPPAFAASANNISSRTRTTASVAWSNANAGTGDVDTSDLSAIVTELVGSYAYNSGVMGFVMMSTNGDQVRDTSITSRDNSATACARLSITWTYPLSTSAASTPMTLAGETVPEGIHTKSIRQTKTGGSTPTGIIGSIRVFIHTLLGGLTFNGVFSRTGTATYQTLTGGIAPSGIVSKVMSAYRTLIGEITPSGILNYLKGVSILLSGGITPSGALTSLRSFLRTLTGSIPLVGSLFQGAKSVARTLIGELSSTGNLSRRLARLLGGEQTFTGALSAIKARAMTLIGDVRFSGSIFKEIWITKLLVGTITLSGSVTKRIWKAFVGSVASAGAFVLSYLGVNTRGAVTLSDAYQTQVTIVETAPHVEVSDAS